MPPLFFNLDHASLKAFGVIAKGRLLSWRILMAFEVNGISLECAILGNRNYLKSSLLDDVCSIFNISPLLIPVSMANSMIALSFEFTLLLFTK